MHRWLRHRYIRLLRLDKPIGIWLLMWPCFWSATLAAETLPFKILMLLFLGSVLMRSAGCIINDLTDREIDRQVERTKTRPLASGEVSAPEALILLALLLLGSLAVAFLLGIKVVMLSALFLPLVIAYPWMKRITFWPQAFLGITFNVGALMGWMAVTGELGLTAWWLYLAGIFWTLGYDTIYALQDAEDDALLGVGSTARLFGSRVKIWVGFFYTAFVFFLVLAGLSLQVFWGYYVLLVLTFYVLFASLISCDPRHADQCLLTFKQQNWVGFMVYIAIISTFYTGTILNGAI